MEHLRLVTGLSADCLTFFGALVLARDGFLRLRDLSESKIEARFRKQFPNLNLEDAEEDRARASRRWALRGLVLVAAGFVFEIAARFLE